MKVLCQFCKSQTNKVEKSEAVRIDEKNFHPKCAELYSNRKELYATICRIFKLKAPGPRNIALINKYKSDGLTFKGMNYSLIYFYEIKKNSIDKANEGIGIVPYIYEEAAKYYNKDKIAEKKATEALEKNKEKRERLSGVTRKVKMPEPKPITINAVHYTDDDYEI